MKALLLLVLLAVLVPVQAQAVANKKFAGKKLNWMERRFRMMSLDRVGATERKLVGAQGRLNKTLAAAEYPDQQKEIDSQQADIALYQREMDEAHENLSKTDELLSKALADKDTRKQFNNELRAALEKENRETAAANSTYRSRYPYPYSSTFTVSCYSSGFGRHFWVRCTSRSY